MISARRHQFLWLLAIAHLVVGCATPGGSNSRRAKRRELGSGRETQALNAENTVRSNIQCWFCFVEGRTLADALQDNDGITDQQDAFPMDATESADSDGDGVGNNADSDDDNDGITDQQDAFPMDATESADRDGDGVGE